MVIDSYGEVNYDQQVPVVSNTSTNIRAVAQSFQCLTGSNYYLTSVKFYLRRQGVSTFGPITAKLYEHGGTFGTSSVPTGAAIATSTSRDITEISNGAGLSLYEFFFTNPWRLIDGTKYIISIEAGSGDFDGNNSLRVGVDSTSPTHSGNYAVNTNGVWAADATKDVIFYTYDDWSNQMSKNTKLFVVGVKSETSQGSAATLAVGTVQPGGSYFLTEKPTIDSNIEKIPRHVGTQAFGAYPFTVGKKTCAVKFKMEVMGSGVSNSAYQPFHDALKACGFTFTGGTAAADWTFTPISADVASFFGAATSCTVEAYFDGIFHKVTGCVGTFKLIAEAGKIATIEFDLKGIYNAVTDTASPASIIYNSTIPPVVSSAALYIDNVQTAIVQKVEIDSGNTVSEIDDVSSANGVKGYKITDRKSKAMVNPELQTVAAYDWWGKHAAATMLNTSDKSISIKIGSTAMNFITFTAVAGQIADLKYGDRGGIVTLDATIDLYDKTTNDWMTILIDNA